MKRVGYLFIILITVSLWQWFYYNSIRKKISNSLHYAVKRDIKKPIAVFNNKSHISHSSHKEKSQLPKKKKIKAVKQTFLPVPNESSFQAIICENESVLFPQILYYPYMLSGNGKRGPPATFFIA